MSDELTRLGTELHAARVRVAEAITAAVKGTRKARKAGLSEVVIAHELGVDRGTVRRWLGKGRGTP